MYIPNAYRETDLPTLVAFMQAHSFVTLVSTMDQIPFASHIPVVVSVEDDVVRLAGHLAKGNPQCRALGQSESLVIFAGPHGYISPSLYEKRESVPTWNYIAVHAYGIPRPYIFADAPAIVEKMLTAMIDFYETDYQPQWAELSDTFRQGLMRGIVGFEMIVTRLEGKYKLSQNRSQTDQATVAEALQQSQNPTISEVGTVMKSRRSNADSSLRSE